MLSITTVNDAHLEALSRKRRSFLSVNDLSSCAGISDGFLRSL